MRWLVLLTTHLYLLPSSFWRAHKSVRLFCLIDNNNNNSIVNSALTLMMMKTLCSLCVCVVFDAHFCSFTGHWRRSNCLICGNKARGWRVLRLSCVRRGRHGCHVRWVSIRITKITVMMMMMLILCATAHSKRDKNISITLSPISATHKQTNRQLLMLLFLFLDIIMVTSSTEQKSLALT